MPPNDIQVTPQRVESPSGSPGEVSAPPWLLSLDEIEGNTLPLVGGKAFRLAVLKRQGFQVPAGLVLTTHFFEAQLKHAHFVPLWAGTPDIAVTAEALSWLADALKLKPLARELAGALQARIEDLFGPGIDRFAVRSSIIDEDQHDHTFAGIHLTELSVPRSALPIAITRCWASALSQPAIKYRQVNGMSIQGIRIAVLIQPMLSPQSSGVGFTLNPLTGAREELVIEAVWGLGQALVSGEVQPYFYKLANQPPDYPLLEQRQGTVSGDEPGENPLSPGEITTLAQQLGRIQALMGEAQDVEWARQDQTFLILQSRPITALPEAPPALDQEWARSDQAGSLPELPSPLFASFLERSQAEIIRLFKGLGLKVDRLGPYQKIILGRAYLNLTLLRRVLVQLGINGETFLQLIGYTASRTPSRLLSVDWKAAWQTRQIYRTALKHTLSPSYYLQKSQALLAEIECALAESGESSTGEGVRQLGQLGLSFNLLALADLSLSMNIAGITGLGARLVAPHAKVPHALVKSLALQEIETEAGKLHRALASLAAGCDGETREYLLNQPDFASFSHNNLPAGAFRSEFEQLLNRYGHRATYEADPAQPRFEEDPAPLLNLLKQMLSGTETAPETNHTSKPGLEPVTSLSPWRRWLLKPVLNSLRHRLLIREELDNLRARTSALCRRWSLRLGQEWVAAGWLETVEDIFWLTWSEIERTLIARSSVAITLSSTVKARKETYHSYRDIQMPFHLRDSEIPTLQFGRNATGAERSDVIMGLPISPGQTRGTVVVIRHPTEFEKVANDVILVMPSTDPTWLALLPQVVGLIVETGGLLSHGSVIAREYGLPAVANIPQATQRFHTGDKVLLDGSTGIIQLLEVSATLHPQ